MIERLRSGGYDDDGDPIGGTPSRRPLRDVLIAPRSSSDVTDRGRAGVIVGLSLLAPYGADVLHTDQIEITGEGPHDGLYDVDGDAAHWKNRISGWEAGCEIALTRAAG